jgi:hypothetical protein
LVEHLRGAGLPTGGQAGYHLIRYAGLKGVLRYGPNENRLAGYLPANLPAGPLSPADEEAAYFRLARRYLQAYSPAGPEDLAVWAGIPLTRARKAFDGISKQLRLITFDGMEALVLQEGGSTPDHDGTGAPIVNLIPAFDPYLLGYKDREPALPARYARRIHPGGGVLRPALLLNGQAAGTWNLKRSAGRAQLSIIPFETLGAAVLEQIQVAATAIGHFYSVEIAVEVAAAES